jgi:hypothetical protein
MTKNDAIDIIESGDFANLTSELKNEVIEALKDNYDDYCNSEDWDSSNCSDSWESSSC